MTTVVLHIEDSEVEKVLETLQPYQVKVMEKKQEKTNAIDKLLAKPLQIVDFQPLKRHQVYE
jgi:hypothetical protein